MIRCKLFLIAGLVAAAAGVQAQEWPTQPVKLLVGSAPGGGTDAMARAVADRLGPLLKQSVVVENRPGASNTLAADITAKSTDGHTLVMGVSTAHAIAPHLLKLGYDNNKDLVPVAFVGAVPNVLVVNPGLGVATVADLVKMAKSKPGQLNYATSGAGSTQHIAAELFKDVTGTFILEYYETGSLTRQVGYEIVGEDEADPAQGRIAPHAPLARSLMGARVGDVVVWTRPVGRMELEVLAIAPAGAGA